MTGRITATPVKVAEQRLAGSLTHRLQKLGLVYRYKRNLRLYRGTLCINKAFES
jgi:hypothetical protein